MTKEYLEAFESIMKIYGNTNSLEGTYNYFLIIKQALQRLEAIDNANPSEALEWLERIKTQLFGYFKSTGVSTDYINDYEELFVEPIKQALIKAQEQEKFFDDKLVFKNGCIMSGFDYKGKQIVAMPLEEYDEFMKQKKAQENNSINLLMQELDCKDFETLRKYARCGYERLNNFKGSKEFKIEIPESSLMDYNLVKNYLKWEDLEFKKEEQTMKVLLNGERYLVKYVNEWFCGWCNKVQITNGTFILCTLGNGMKQFFNDLHLERVEE